MITTTFLIKIIPYSFLLILPISCDRYRLPVSVIPKHYSLSFLTSTDEFSSFKGTVDIVVQCVNDTKKITLHRDFGLKFGKIKVQKLQGPQNLDSKSDVGLKQILFSPAESFLMISTMDKLVSGHFYRLHFEFEGNITDNGYGVIKKQILPEGNFYILTNFEPVGARKAFPCFDEPHLTSGFEIKIGRPEKFKSTFNTPLLDKLPVEGKDGWVWDNFKKSDPIPTYSVSFMIFDESFTWITKPDKMYRILSRQVMKQGINMVVSTVPKIFKYLRTFIQIPFPFAKLDIIVVPDFPGIRDCRSNPGIIICEESLLLYQVTNMKQQQVQNILTELTENIVNQWLTIIAIDWWSFMWFKDSLACYTSRLALDEMSDGHSLEIDISDALLLILDDEVGTPLHIEISAEEKSVIKAVNEIDKLKGLILLRMINLLLGTDDPKKLPFTLFKSFTFQQMDLKRAISSLESIASHEYLKGDISLYDIIRSWTSQEGCPIVFVKRNYYKKSALLTQELFTQQAQDGKRCWWIPVTYTTRAENKSLETAPRAWLPCPNETIEISSFDRYDWFLLNIRMIAPFRIYYDEDNWKLLSYGVEDPRHHHFITRWNRLQLIEDEFLFGRKGMLSFDVIFQSLNYLGYEKTYPPWAAAVKNLFNFHWRFEHNHAVVTLLDRYMQRILRFHFPKQKLLITEATFINLKLRTLLIECSCFFGHTDTITEIKKSFENYKESIMNVNRSSEIVLEIRDLIFCYGIRYGNKDDFDFLLKEWQESKIFAERGEMLTGLYCTNDQALFQKIHSNARRRRQDRFISKRDEKTKQRYHPKMSRNQNAKERPDSGIVEESGASSESNDETSTEKSKSESVSHQSDKEQKPEIPSPQIPSEEDSSTTPSEIQPTEDDVELTGGQQKDNADLFFILRHANFEIASTIFYKMINNVRPSMRKFYINAFIARINKQDDLISLEKFIREHHQEFQPQEKFIQQKTVAVEADMKWQKDNSKQVEEALRSNIKFLDKKSVSSHSQSSFTLILKLIILYLFYNY